MSRTKLILSDIRKSLEPIRLWVDGEVRRDPAEEIALHRTTQSHSEQFMLSVARELDRVLKEEFVSNRIKGAAYVPARFAVFLSSADDKAWGGRKRTFLGETLGDIILREAEKMCGKTLRLTVDSIEVEIRVDGTLSQGELYVRPVSDSATETTIFSANIKRVDVDGATVFDPSGAVSGAKPLYFLEIVQPGQQAERVPIYKREITIGRGSQNDPVDVKLEGESRISRIHSSLQIDSRGKIWLTAKGTNPTLLAGRVVSRGERVQVKPAQAIEIYEVTLRVKLKAIKRRRAKSSVSEING